MANSKTSKTDERDASLGFVQAIDQLDLKAFSFIQLRRTYTALMQAAADVDEELKARAENDHEGDTVRVPVPTAKKQES
jgi:hypothetical protein